MPNYLAVVTLAKKSGIPQDAVVNTFAFNRGGVGGPIVDGAAIKAALSTFYNTAPAGGTTLASWLSASMSGAGTDGKFQLYDVTAHLGGTPHGSPVFTSTFGLGAVGADALPDEVAACLSIQSAYGTDVEFAPGARPRSTDRGRIFIGPLKTAAVSSVTATLEPILSPAFTLNLSRCARDLLLAAPDWSVWSRKKATFAPVIGGWVDNAFDTQRRRGNKPSLRSVFP